MSSLVYLPPPFRRASATDARALAQLMNCAGEGIPSLLWEQSVTPGETPLDVGARRAARKGVNFSYQNAIVGESAGEVTCMLLGYSIEKTDAGNVSELPIFLHPLARLECKAAGTWYVNAMAVFDKFRGRGLGSQLLGLATAVTIECGCRATSLIVASSNAFAKGLYERQGYRIIERERVIPHPRLVISGEWLLMLRSVR